MLFKTLRKTSHLYCVIVIWIFLFHLTNLIVFVTLISNTFKVIKKLPVIVNGFWIRCLICALHSIAVVNSPWISPVYQIWLKQTKHIDSFSWICIIFFFLLREDLLKQKSYLFQKRQQAKDHFYFLAWKKNQFVLSVNFHNFF